MVAKHCPYNSACDEDGGPTVTASCISTSAGNAWKVVTGECESQDVAHGKSGTAAEAGGVEPVEAGEAGNDAAAPEAGNAAAADGAAANGGD
jgi:hypothetical protein